MLEIKENQNVYQREVVITEGEKDEEFYFMKMILENQIRGLLKAKISVVDNVRFMCYDVNGKENMKNWYGNHPVTYHMLYSLWDSIVETLEAGKEYILPEEHYIFLPEWIYVSSEDNEVYEFSFLYHHEYVESISDQFKKLTEYLMEVVDYKDKIAVKFVYGLYGIIHKSSCTIEVVKEFLENSKIEIEDIKEKENHVIPAAFLEENIEKSSFSEEYTNKKLMEQRTATIAIGGSIGIVAVAAIFIFLL